MTHSFRSATSADAPGIAELFQGAYSLSSHPCKDERMVAGTIGFGTTLWRLATMGERIIGCMACVLYRWNRSAEIARGVTDPEFRNLGLGSRLYYQCVDAACASPDCDVIAAYPRSNITATIGFRATPPVLFMGHDAGINIANQMREYHGVALARNPNAAFRHVKPDAASLADSAFVRERIYAPLGPAPVPGEYPPQWIAGEGAAHPDLRPFTFGYNPLCPSDAIEITGYTGRARRGRQVAEELVAVLESFYNTRHARLAVLADKTDFIAALLGHGFRITAYLPAWCHYGDDRFDCVLLARTQFATDPVDHGLREMLDLFDGGFAAAGSLL